VESASIGRNKLISDLRSLNAVVGRE
jgi:hypothetical protein